jgi:hypothetical protein
LDGELVIPDKPGDLGFLEGCWKSDAGMVDKLNQMPVIMWYCFRGGSGQATVRVEELDESGRIRNVCSASGNARLAGRGVVITDSGARCPAGQLGYNPFRIECSPGSGEAASCTVRDGSGAGIKTRFTFQGADSG